jgi:6,7-dimethyl-8-ribityllumazine synthase
MATRFDNTNQESIEHIHNAEDKIFGIVVSEWNPDITNALLKGCLEKLEHAKIKPENIRITYVPGSFELPFGAQQSIVKNKPNAVICLGCVIKGETPHFDFISQAVANGIMNLGLQHHVPVVFGVLTTNTLEQAQARSGGKHGNKGHEAGITALKTMI